MKYNYVRNPKHKREPVKEGEDVRQEETSQGEESQSEGASEPEEGDG